MYDCWRSWYCQRVPLACLWEPGLVGVILGSVKLVIFVTYTKRVEPSKNLPWRFPRESSLLPPPLWEKTTPTGVGLDTTTLPLCLHERQRTTGRPVLWVPHASSSHELGFNCSDGFFVDRMTPQNGLHSTSEVVWLTSGGNCESCSYM